MVINNYRKDKIRLNKLGRRIQLKICMIDGYIMNLGYSKRLDYHWKKYQFLEMRRNALVCLKDKIGFGSNNILRYNYLLVKNGYKLYTK